MNKNANMLDFVKAMSDPNRLKIVGLLTRQPASLSQVTEALSMTNRQAYNHLEFLKFVEVVVEQDGLYVLQTDALETLARHELEIPRSDPNPVPGPANDRQKILAKFLRTDGTVRQIPNSRTQSEAFRIVLEYIQTAFEPGGTYTEKEVNTLIHRFHEDTSGLRRDLIEAGLLARERDGSKYWRVS